MEGQAKRKGIRVEAENPAKGCPEEISVDPDRMNQVFLNLYLNAVESMDNGGILSIFVSNDDHANRLRVTVSDTGRGIAAEDLVHVFDPYFTTKPSGTGLGLAIVHNIVEAHGGDVRVESELGKGTRVVLSLPYG
jgi:two-component system sensor histidine kinase HydH